MPCSGCTCCYSHREMFVSIFNAKAIYKNAATKIIQFSIAIQNKYARFVLCNTWLIFVRHNLISPMACILIACIFFYNYTLMRDTDSRDLCHNLKIHDIGRTTCALLGLTLRRMCQPSIRFQWGPSLRSYENRITRSVPLKWIFNLAENQHNLHWMFWRDRNWSLKGIKMHLICVQ